MELVGCTHLARAKWWERSQDVRDFAIFVRAMRRRDQFDWPEARCNYDETAPMLRNPITRAIDHPFLGVFGEMETFVGENGQEVVENLVALEFGYVLHTHDVGFQLSDETAEVPEQGPLRVTVVLEPLGIFRKRLAWCAPDENARMTFRIVTGQIASSDFGYAFVAKYYSRIIMLIWKAAHLIGVVTGGYVHARVQEAASQPTRSAKEVDRCCGWLRGFSHLLFISIM